MPNTQPNPEIVAELYRTLILLGAESDLLGTVGSWGDSLSDEDVLARLRQWNAATQKQTKERIEHYEISSRPLVDIPVEAREMGFQVSVR